MNCEKIGNIIRALRKEQGLTQKQLADRLGITDKTVSKWECGLGCPDISFLPELSEILKADISGILLGELSPNNFVGGNMKKSKYFICSSCGNISISTGNSEVSCCGRKLEGLVPVKADEVKKLKVETIENQWYITSDHPMTKENYISFIALASSGKIQIIKQYPEWDLQLRIPNREHGMLIWYSLSDGLLYQNI